MKKKSLAEQIRQHKHSVRRYIEDSNVAECHRCHRTVRIYAPAGGDGSAREFITHKTPDGKRCDGSRDTVLGPL